MTPPSPCPPRIGPDDKVVLFDGVCKLCSAWARFLISHDTKRVFKLASVQSTAGREILEFYGLPTDHYTTMLLVEGPRIYTKSAAFIRVVMRLPWPWPILAAGWIVLAPLRDWAYDRIALNRYQLFGKYDACVIPTPDHLIRYLDDAP